MLFNKMESHKHHYIPQFILRNFSARNDGFVKFYDLKKKTIVNKPTEEIFLYEDLYRDEKNYPNNPTKIEDDLAKYESEVALILKKFCTSNEIVISTKEEEKLRLFLLQYLCNNLRFKRR